MAQETPVWRLYRTAPDRAPCSRGWCTCVRGDFNVLIYMSLAMLCETRLVDLNILMRRTVCSRISGLGHLRGSRLFITCQTYLRP